MRYLFGFDTLFSKSSERVKGKGGCEKKQKKKKNKYAASKTLRVGCYIGVTKYYTNAKANVIHVYSSVMVTGEKTEKRAIKVATNCISNSEEKKTKSTRYL